MMTPQRLRSPIPWIGGKYYSASRIVSAFPAPQSYEVYVDLFGGAAHVLLAKPPYKHAEVYNDISSHLVNFWMQCRNNGPALEERCQSLPYSREVYYQYHKSLFDGTSLDRLERAVRWFYVQRSSFTGWERESSPPGWKGGIRGGGTSDAEAYRSALTTFTTLQARFRHVLIDHRDFAAVIQSYDRPRVLLYVDPPYIGAEGYYQQDFGAADHERLASLLNTTPAFVALSYYPHPLLDALYPASKWRRITWTVTKHSQRTAETREQATEMLLCNYPTSTQALPLWEEEEAYA